MLSILSRKRGRKSRYLILYTEKVFFIHIQHILHILQILRYSAYFSFSAHFASSHSAYFARASLMDGWQDNMLASGQKGANAGPAAVPASAAGPASITSDA